jgi:uncharacterized protein YbbC (DUF1343 family)
LCFFEGTDISIGRGTSFPFQVYGHPDMPGEFSFIPKSLPGLSVHPLHENKVCRGRDLRGIGAREIAERQGLVLEWIIDAWQKMGKSAGFFTGYFDTLAGTDQLRIQIQQGVSLQEIRASWEPGLRKYREMRGEYLLYRDGRQ